MNRFQAIADTTPAPIARATIQEKVETFERRMNGAVLPFLGLHGALLALLYILEAGDLPEELAGVDPWLAPGLLLGAALLCALLTAARHLRGRGERAGGGAAMAVTLASIAFLLSAPGAGGLILAVVLNWSLLLLNGSRRLPDHEINTAWLYLPFVVLLTTDLDPLPLIVAFAAFYLPAIVLKFAVQPESSKVCLGFSALVFLAGIIDAGSGQELAIGVMVLLVLLLFGFYAWRQRDLPASALRHLATDAIVFGLWGALVAVLSPAGSFQTNALIWGLGVGLYEAALLALRRGEGLPDAARRAERDARLVWLQVAALAVFGPTLLEDVLEPILGQDDAWVAILLVVVWFIPLFEGLRAPFLALATRVWIASCLIAALTTTEKALQAYLPNDFFNEPAQPPELFMANLWYHLAWPLLAFVIALWATARVEPVPLPAWWRGLFRPRHVVLVRRGGRLVVANANRIAFVGGFIAAVSAFLDWLRYAGGERQGLASRDVLLIGAHVFAVAITVLFARYWLGCCEPAAYPALEAEPLVFQARDWPFLIACCLWGLALYLQGVWQADPLPRFFAAAFLLMPLATYGLNNTANDDAFLAATVAVCGFGLLLLGATRRVGLSQSAPPAAGSGG